jgi:hypothetical protein
MRSSTGKIHEILQRLLACLPFGMEVEASWIKYERLIEISFKSQNKHGDQHTKEIIATK